MRRIIPELTGVLSKHFGDPAKISSAQPYKIKTFRELVEHTAQLSFKNKDYLIFYRGQNKDYKNKAGSSTIYPSIYRGDYLPLRELVNRFDILDGACKALVELFEQERIEGYQELKRRKSIQWSLLQHYEVCPTPYTDFTQSLRVACSFALISNPSDEGYVNVYGFPYITNRISVNSEHDLINIRLLSICPPTALRPYFQEGYLAGTDDITTNYDVKTELDFSNRLIAKFVIPKHKKFWSDGFHEIPKNALLPENDPIWELCQKVKDVADKNLKPGDLGEFIKSWAELENKIISISGIHNSRLMSVREAMRNLFARKEISEELFIHIDKLRMFRNQLVHSPSKIDSKEIKEYIELLQETKSQFKSISI